MHKYIDIKGAKENNLKNIDVKIPRDKLVVLTGLSGSGKSSLAFETIYAEGQRRYVESLSAYARQFLGQMEKPNVDSIDGLSPAISIDQKTTSKNPRSTVGTVTEVYDYVRLLFARIGVPHCPRCGKEIRSQSIDQIVDAVMEIPEKTKFQILAPVVRGRKGEYTKVFEKAAKDGFVRVRVDGEQYDPGNDEIVLDKQKKHNIEIVVDRLIKRDGIENRLADSLETALKMAGGLVVVELIEEQKEMMFSQTFACEDCGISLEELTPRMFSFNTPYGACPHCMGLGSVEIIDPDRLIPDKTKSVNEGAVSVYGWNGTDPNSISAMYYRGLSEHYGFSLDTPVKDLPKEVMDILLYGTNGEKVRLSYERKFAKGEQYARFEGILNNVERRYKETNSEWARREIQELMYTMPCPECKGTRLKKESLSVTVDGHNIDEISNFSIAESLEFFKNLKLSEREELIGRQILKEIIARLHFLESVGLEYLTLSRSSGTLSGGEAQRI